MYQDHSEFITDNDIQSWCYNPSPCENAKIRPGVNGRKWIYCEKYRGPCFKVLTLCKEDKKNQIHKEKAEAKEAKKQRRIQDYCGRLIS